MSFFNPFRGTPSKEAGKPKATSGTGTPLELISYDTQTGKFQLGSKALEVLRSVSSQQPLDEPLAKFLVIHNQHQMLQSGRRFLGNAVSVAPHIAGNLIARSRCSFHQS